MFDSYPVYGRLNPVFKSGFVLIFPGHVPKMNRSTARKYRAAAATTRAKNDAEVGCRCRGVRCRGFRCGGSPVRCENTNLLPSPRPAPLLDLREQRALGWLIPTRGFKALNAMAACRFPVDTLVDILPVQRVTKAEPPSSSSRRPNNRSGAIPPTTLQSFQTAVMKQSSSSLMLQR